MKLFDITVYRIVEQLVYNLVLFGLSDNFDLTETLMF